MDRKDLNKLHQEYSRELYYYALGFVHLSDVAEEILQDAFVKLWENKDSIRNKVGYLKHIIKNLSYNYIRDNKRQEEYKNDYADFVFSSIDIDDEINETIEKIRSSISKLPKQAQKVLILKCVSGLKNNEISEELGISVNTVKSHLKVAYKKIKEDVNVSTIATNMLVYIFFKHF